MANLVAAGIDPAFVAARVLAGIADNDLYILTHPELRDVIAGRFDRIWPPSKRRRSSKPRLRRRSPRA